MRIMEVLDYKKNAIESIPQGDTKYASIMYCVIHWVK